MNLLEIYKCYKPLFEDWYESENVYSNAEITDTENDPSQEHRTFANYGANDTNPKTKDFVAIDTEWSVNKGNERFIIQLSAVKVLNGKIESEKDWMIYPGNGQIDKFCFNTHRISLDMLQGCPTFDKIYDEFIDFIGNLALVFHNASADLTALARTCDYYNLPFCGENDIIDTYSIFPYSLDICCDALGVNMGTHHNALDDARATANIYLKYVSGDYDDLSFYEAVRKKEARGPYEIKKEFKIQKDLNSIENKGNTFYDKKVVITGIFYEIGRNDVAKAIQDLGGKVNGSISKKTNIVVMGDAAGPSKVEKIKELEKDGYDIRIITEKELLEILKGENTMPQEESVSHQVDNKIYYTSNEKLMLKSKNIIEHTYKDGNGIVVVNNGSIEQCMFSYQKHLTSIVISQGFRTIAQNAFAGCKKLSKIEIPLGVEKIGVSAFEDCSSLKEVIIPSSVKKIGNEAFYGCSSLTSVVIPEGVMCIGDSVFENCSKLDSITIPASLKKIEGYIDSLGCDSVTYQGVKYSVWYNTSSRNEFEKVLLENGVKFPRHEVTYQGVKYSIDDESSRNELVKALKNNGIENWWVKNGKLIIDK